MDTLEVEPELKWECPFCEEAIAEWDICPHCGWNPYPIIPDGWSDGLAQ